jgi:hypothetical protein
MASNDPIILDSTITQKKSVVGVDYSDADFFEIFTSEQALKDYELSYEELDDGKIGGGDDGGIDGFFFFINGDYIIEKIDPADFKMRPSLNLFVIQSKQSPSFTEDIFQRINTTIQDIFDLSKDVKKLASFYNANLLEKVNIFRESYLSLASKHPILKITYVYASKGDTSGIHKKVRNEADLVVEKTKEKFTGAQVDIKFFGAKELLELSRIEKTYTLTLNFIETFLSKGEDNYVVLTNLKEYFDFITDEDGNLRKYIFESNVRDYQGNVEVNIDILKTLSSEKELDFWWLNNGITILASRASVTGKTITLDDVQIINGLQTTNCIWKHFNEKQKNGEASFDDEKNKSVLVKILIIDKDESRDKIIKATNFQTAIPTASLKATEKIQRDIEDYFKANDLFYDRRKNFYKNSGKSATKIISIPLLAQSLNSIIRKEPHTSRARPASLLKSNEVYGQLFGEEITPEIYLFCAQVIKKIQARFREQLAGYTAQEKSNLRFQVLMATVIKLLKTKEYGINDLKALKISDISIELIDSATKEVIDLTKNFMAANPQSLDVLSKSKDLTDYILENITITTNA